MSTLGLPTSHRDNGRLTKALSLENVDFRTVKWLILQTTGSSMTHKHCKSTHTTRQWLLFRVLGTRGSKAPSSIASQSGISKCVQGITRQAMYSNVTVRHIHATSVAVEKQSVCACTQSCHQFCYNFHVVRSWRRWDGWVVRMAVFGLLSLQVLVPRQFALICHSINMEWDVK